MPPHRIGDRGLGIAHAAHRRRESAKRDAVPSQPGPGPYPVMGACLHPQLPRWSPPGGTHCMAIYPDAYPEPGQDAGSYLGGPWRIVWHTTEGDTAQEAFAHFRRKNTWPHFTV